MPDELWALVEPLIPVGKTCPQGGGMSRVDDRAVFTAIVFVLTSGCAWRHLPPSFGVTVPMAHRRFSEWTTAGLWREVHRAVLDELGSKGVIDWSRAVLQLIRHQPPRRIIQTPRSSTKTSQTPTETRS